MDDKSWTIDGGRLSSTDYENVPIRKLQAGPLGSIMVEHKDGATSTHQFKFFYHNDNTPSEAVKRSRTLFLQWIYNDKTPTNDLNPSVKDSDCRESANTSKEDAESINDDTGSSIINDDSQKESVGGQDVDDNETDDDAMNSKNTLPESIDKDMIKKHLKGSSVAVHVKNLIEPLEKYLVRPLDESHINTIVGKLKDAHSLCTTLVGMVDNECDITTLNKPGKHKVQIIGGNHTRAALQSLGNGDEDVLVSVDLYCELSVEQALHVAYMHNEMHETSRQMTFAEKVSLFRTIRKKVLSEEKSMKSKTCSAIWRGRIASIVNKTRNEVRNSYRVHLNLAAASDNVWEALESVFVAAKEKRIRGLKDDLSIDAYSP